MEARSRAAVGAVALSALLAGCAASSQTVDPVSVTGTERWCVLPVAEDDYIEADCTDEASDPRVSGAMHAEMSLLEGSSLYLWSGTATLVNDDGTWTGPVMGTWQGTPAINWYDAVLFGTGDYAGLRYTLHLEGPDAALAITGTIEPVDSTAEEGDA